MGGHRLVWTRYLWHFVTITAIFIAISLGVHIFEWRFANFSWPNFTGNPCADLFWFLLVPTSYGLKSMDLHETPKSGTFATIRLWSFSESPQIAWMVFKDHSHPEFLWGTTCISPDGEVSKIGWVGWRLTPVKPTQPDASTHAGLFWWFPWRYQLHARPIRMGMSGVKRVQQWLNQPTWENETSTLGT